MLRPATPLSILFFAAFALLLLSTLSTPIIKAIPLASSDGWTYGVFGYCEGDKCSDITIGYAIDKVGPKAGNDFSLPQDTRHSLSSILIVHPVAALLTLICFIMSVSAHFHAPAHSPRYLLALLVLIFPTLLVTLLAFLVDILVFVPHLQWGGWIVLAATIILAVCAVVTCAMRRTLVSRKARRKRIAENPDMNGANGTMGFYNNPPPPPGSASVVDDFPRAESPPPLPLGMNDNDKMPEFATFELKQQRTNDDRTPLNPRNPSIRSAGTGNGDGSSNGYGDQGMNYGPPGSAGRGGHPPQRDHYGNIVPQNGYATPPSGMPGPGQLRNQGSNGNMGPNRGGPLVGASTPPYYGGRGRGGFPPRGGYPSRGGYPPRGGPQGMRGPPPPGWNGNGRGGMGPMMGRGQRPPPPPGNPGYDTNYYGAPVPGRELSPSRYNGPGDVSPVDHQGPIGQAIEMDARSGTPSNYKLRDSGSDVAGMIGLQQTKLDVPPPQRNEPISPSSIYSPHEYLPPRAQWAQNNQNSPDSLPGTNAARALSPIQASPIELPVQPVELASGPVRKGPVAAKRASDNYYEDVDPRFAEPDSVPLPSRAIPSSALMPNPPPQPTKTPPQNPSPPYLRPGDNSSGQLTDRDRSYEDINEGPRSPAASEASHFTSVSQRGINPNWRPPPGQPPYGPPPRRPDVILEQNPDFSLPPGGRGRGGFRGRGGRMPGVIPPMNGPGGRYPRPNEI